MKKILSFIAITALLFACSKTDITPTEASKAEATEKAKGGNGGGGGGGGAPTLVVTTLEASYVLLYGATCGGSVSKSGGGDKVTERGVCYSTDPGPTIDDITHPSGSGSGSFTIWLSLLTPETEYFVKAYASVTKNGTTTTTYGDEVSFTTPEFISGTVTDIDGNTYTTIQIGTQTWMMGNLKTTHYSNGDEIPHVPDATEWAGLTTDAYCNYGNSTVNGDIYGRLYNWYAVETGNLCPGGWHVSTTAELSTLTSYVGGYTVAGFRLKEAGTDHWTNQPPGAGDNGSGFTALPGGARNVYGSSSFGSINSRGYWWTADQLSDEDAEYMFLQTGSWWAWGISNGGSGDNHKKNTGYSVRCIKDVTP